MTDEIAMQRKAREAIAARNSLIGRCRAREARYQILGTKRQRTFCTYCA